MKMRLFVPAMVLAAGLCGFAMVRFQRAAVLPVERSFDERIARFSVDDPMYVLGAARGVYLEGFGLVLSTEVDLLPGANITPFRPAFTKEEKARIRARKLERLGKLRELMRAMLVDAAGMVDTVPENDQVAVAVTLFHKSWEDTSGLPGQIVMQAPRKALIAYKTSNSPKRQQELEAVLKVREY
jgi:hypothetical protein